MSTVKYFSGTQEVPHFQYMDNRTFAACFPGIKGQRVDGFSKLVCVTPALEVLPITRTIFYKSNPSLHKCDARCTNAKGKNCECSCGGANHGSQA